MADEIFQAVLKDMKESKNEQAVPQGPPDVCLCRMHVWKRVDVWEDEDDSSKICGLATKEEKVEE